MTKAPKARQNQIKTEAPSPKQDEFAEALAALRIVPYDGLPLFLHHTRGRVV